MSCQFDTIIVVTINQQRTTISKYMHTPQACRTIQASICLGEAQACENFLHLASDLSSASGLELGSGLHQLEQVPFEKDSKPFNGDKRQSTQESKGLFQSLNELHDILTIVCCL